jgi:hypothetical protein
VPTLRPRTTVVKPPAPVQDLLRAGNQAAMQHHKKVHA